MCLWVFECLLIEQKYVGLVMEKEMARPMYFCSVNKYSWAHSSYNSLCFDFSEGCPDKHLSVSCSWIRGLVCLRCSRKQDMLSTQGKCGNYLRGQRRAHSFSTGMSREDYGESSIWTEPQRRGGIRVAFAHMCMNAETHMVLCVM